ncbi:hypothetical protein XaraCFBP7407_16735 [Xanthomonas arboricola pv. arracaciae]|nr:hypothetical protein XaraCFBP7407_16735 [Xanthomonas arboricola pv. arracaciae]
MTADRREEERADLFDLLHRIFHGAWTAASADFSGLGLVLYQGHHALPHLALTASDPPDLDGAFGAERVAEVLSKLASTRSLWHDGFHFVDVAGVRLTHVAQFISPPISKRLRLGTLVGGARHMSAALASMIDGVAMVGVLTSKGEISVYLDGERIQQQEIGP